MTRILLVDDEINVLNALVRAMRQHLPLADLHIETFIDPFDALSRCAEASFDIVISDFRMPTMNGVEFLHAMMETAPTTVRMILSASTEFDTVSRAISEAHVFRYISKPWQMGDLQESIRTALLYRAELLANERLGDTLRLQTGQLTAQEAEARQLEREEPGLTKVKWGPKGEILM